ncbi:MAG: hypothetical protein [Cressdnaviricota sp.]|nr:MAG: hypothetical protein [Cressdnaviricota sp.]
MAKRKYSMTKAKKIQPVPLKLNYVMSAEQGTGYIDLARDVSRLARKFIRQGHLFAIGNIRVTMPAASTPTAGNAVYVSAAQNTWVVSNAWEKSFRHWQRQQNEALEDGGSQSAKARFNDFKVYLDKNHQQTGNLDPVNMGPFDVVGPFPTAVVTSIPPLAGEWEYSQIVIPNDGAVGVTNEYNLTIHGTDTASTKGMALGYARSRSYPQSPDPATPTVRNSWMQQMFDVGDDNSDVLDNAEFRNNELPYDQDDYPGTPANYQYPENKAWCFNRSTVGVNTFNLGGMVAPCGLLRIDQLFSTGSPTDLILEIELLPGTTRGYHLESMTEM